MLKVVVGVNDVTTSILPREDLTLCNDRGRVALQETLPNCNARGIQERTLGMAPGSVQILGDEVVESAMTAELLGSWALAPRGARWTLGTRRGPTNVLRVQAPLRSQKPRPPPSPLRVAMTRHMAHDAEAGGSGRPRSWETPATSGPESRTADPEGQPRLGGGAHSPPTKKKKTAPAPEGRPFVRLPWGFTAGPAKSSGTPSALGAGETEGATAVPPDANLPQCEEAPAPEDVAPYHRGEVGQPPIAPSPCMGGMQC
ncbi:hypothetical protein E2562_004989 [Oryza meyeriana var. granulata]|uniref:Uncharacterized protein n=1 Tax=Oryza meyeriana var. granulata TaxID=110450 RepID=A0A6G1C4B1_9ORYZ|nr:hypothetical protein E2562_004989 [Oryza meyeriana var. granulata]